MNVVVEFFHQICRNSDTNTDPGCDEENLKQFMSVCLQVGGFPPRGFSFGKTLALYHCNITCSVIKIRLLI